MKIALTGASGYVGGCIARRLVADGHEVLSLSRRPCPPPWHAYSLGEDPSTLPWGDVDALIHAAYDFSPRTWEAIRTRNIDPAIALAEAAKAAGVRHLWFISSMSAFTGCRSLYGKAKLAIESRMLKLGGQVIRPGLVWGEHPGGVMGALDSMVAKLPVVPYLVGSGGLQQYLIHEEDLAGAVSHLIASAPASPTVHSLAHPEPLTMKSILSLLAARRGVRRVFFPLHWSFAMLPLLLAEVLGLKVPFRSDSLTGLVHGNPSPSFSAAPCGFEMRPFR